ncbi:unnamed protein product [Parnassius mnemosyne]|uniref:GIY-YIG homing endonuclease n=1 Tax=Parnassius mnemosyne TaxID=213953 RepID=A0AAV1L6Y6_9NEOP
MSFKLFTLIIYKKTRVARIRESSSSIKIKLPKKISQFLSSVKCHIPLQDVGVYKLDCECGLSYIGQTKRSIKFCLKEHIADLKHRRSGKSAICEHVQDRPRHYIRCDRPQIITTGLFARLLKFKKKTP